PAAGAPAHVDFAASAGRTPLAASVADAPAGFAAVATASAVSTAVSGATTAAGYPSAPPAPIQSRDDEAALRLPSKAPAGDHDVRILKEQPESRLTGKLYEGHLRPDRVPLLTRPISEMTAENLSPAESYLLSRMDGAWDIQSIVAISPLREIDALLT